MERSTSGRLNLDIERSMDARARAERALVSLLHALGDESPPLIVLGGLVPEMLTRGQNPPVPRHLGTTDVDLFVELSVDTEEDLSRLEPALTELGFRPKDAGGWCWIGTIEGAPMKLEFLCERDDAPEETVYKPRGCDQFGALNLRGPGYVQEDWTKEKLSTKTVDGQVVEVRFAALFGYLLSKACAVRHRGHEKDYYDFVYVLLYNRLGGPKELGEALQNGRFGDRLLKGNLTSVWNELSERFGAPDRVGPQGYANQAVQVEPDADTALKRNDAVAAARAFLTAIGFKS